MITWLVSLVMATCVAARTVTTPGVIAEGRVRAGEDLPGDVWHADRTVLLIVGEFE